MINMFTKAKQELKYQNRRIDPNIFPEKSFKTTTSRSINSIAKFLKKNKKYKPLQSTVMGCG